MLPFAIVEVHTSDYSRLIVSFLVGSLELMIDTRFPYEVVEASVYD
jgi:hypothetical protein